VQLKQKLKIRGLPALLIEAVIDRLEQAGVLDEAYLAQSLEEKAKRQHRSLRLSKQNLSSKGLTPSKLEWKEAHDLDKENALYWLRRWSLRDDLRKKPERYWARLATRGFDFAPIQEAWSVWIKECSDENSK
jgi:SOS response regulatory protein OraA/RecX